MIADDWSERKILPLFRNKRPISLFTSSKWFKSNTSYSALLIKLAFLDDPVVEKLLIISEITVSALQTYI